MTATAPLQRIVVSDGRSDPDADRPVRLGNCLPAFALGLLAPAVTMLVVDPSALARLAFVLPGLLTPMLLVVIAIFVYCVLMPGEVVAVSADPRERCLTVVEANLFARRRTELPFRDIADIRLANAYDADGYATRRAEILLRDDQVIVLPAWVGEAEAADLRQAVRGNR